MKLDSQNLKKNITKTINKYICQVYNTTWWTSNASSAIVFAKSFAKKLSVNILTF